MDMMYILFNYSIFISDYLSVDETAKEPPQQEEGKDSPQRLAMEATYINQALSQQLLIVMISIMCMCLGKTYKIWKYH